MAIGVGQMLLVLLIHLGQTVLAVVKCIVIIVIPGVVHPAVANTVVLAAVYVAVASAVPIFVVVEICLFGGVVTILQLLDLLPQ